MRYFLYPAIVASFAIPTSSGVAAETVTEVVSFADLAFALPRGGRRSKDVLRPR